LTSLSGWSPSGTPIVSGRESSTKVLLKDGETFVMSGLEKKELAKSTSRFPVLGYIPIIDLLFSKTVDIQKESDVLIFITPHILKNVGVSELSSEKDGE